jgi:Cellulose binding domain
VEERRRARWLHRRCRHRERRLQHHQSLDRPLAFADPAQEVTNAWNAAVGESGQNVSASNVSYDRTIGPGHRQTFGFQGSWNTNDPPPMNLTCS